MARMKMMVARYAGTCKCCGGSIAAGEMIEYQRGYGVRHPEHHGDISSKCFANLKRAHEPNIGQMVDMAYEDSCAEICGR